MEQQFSIIKKGYSPDEVNRYIERLEAEIIEYKTDQLSIAKAIIHSENTATRIINDANKEAEQIRQKAESQLLDLQKKIKHMRMKLDAFQSSYNQLMHKYIISMNNDDFNDLFSSLDTISDSLNISEQKDNHNNVIEMKYESAVADY